MASLRVSQKTIGTVGNRIWHSAIPSATTLGRTWSSALTARRQSSDPRGFLAYSDLGVERILALDGNVGEVERLIDDWLADLMSYDDGHGTDLVPTLATYLDLGGRYDDTARALSVHRNTLRYRFGRITEISGRDLADVDTKLNLHLALRAWRLRRAPGAERLVRPSVASLPGRPCRAGHASRGSTARLR